MCIRDRDIDVNFTKPKYFFDKTIYENRVFDSHGVEAYRQVYQEYRHNFSRKAERNFGDVIWLFGIQSLKKLKKRI